ncbi:MAG: hypothetical protein EBZ82_05590, partial [Burkholderiaceae bacterium]|nr:hypothetical protein [Burkholderiaceae bacterium]NDE28360.1 hypothetical protein [Burkholderiaceae bacterium]
MTRYSHKQPIHIDRCVISSPFGSLRISTELVDGSLMISEISYLAKGLSKVRPQNDLARQAKDQIEAYFEDPLFKFNL